MYEKQTSSESHYRGRLPLTSQGWVTPNQPRIVCFTAHHHPRVTQILIIQFYTIIQSIGSICLATSSSCLGTWSAWTFSPPPPPFPCPMQSQPAGVHIPHPLWCCPRLACRSGHHGSHYQHNSRSVRVLHLKLYQISLVRLVNKESTMHQH